MLHYSPVENKPLHRLPATIPGLPLFTLYPRLLEQTINKVSYAIPPPKIFPFEKKSYFRMQRTCRGVGEFIRNSENIVIPLKGEYCITTKSDGSV